MSLKSRWSNGKKKRGGKGGGENGGAGGDGRDREGCVATGGKEVDKSRICPPFKTTRFKNTLGKEVNWCRKGRGGLGTQGKGKGVG